MNSKRCTSFVLAAMLLASVAQTNAISFPSLPTKKQVAIIIPYAALFAGVFRLYMKNPVKTPIANFDKAALKKAYSERNLNEMMNQILYFLDEYYVGQLYKSSKAKVDPDGKNIYIHPGCPPTGLLGRTHAYLYPLGKALGLMVAVKKFLKFARKGIAEWKYYTGYDSEE